MVSVIMSIYNEPENWLREAIDSILNQSFKDFEFIIINDNPNRMINDEILEFYKGKDSRILSIKNENNIGLTKSLNKALKMAKGKYVARMDADDISLRHRFKEQVEFLEKNKHLLACGTDIILINENNKELNKKLKTHFTFDAIKNVFPLFNPIYHPTLFIRNKFITENGIRYNENFKYAQDYELVKEIILKGEIVNLESKLLKYRISSSQISNSKIKEQNEYARSTKLSFLKNTYNLNENDFYKIYFILKRLREKNSRNDVALDNSIISLLLSFPFTRKTILNELIRTRISLKLRVKLFLKILNI
ncbi:glycosyltransferase family 2 protein [Seonamhaeicola marinus]|uniref:Glycosyltransferase n=1 Tax=Seonamhaeicola marinus TaxID=1912246 RepID=A0A5D0HS74_9FLAO|nr:glycosyltransferase family 2 protein [Seonamhaeicola marinus]TYA74128.1 glycosyltransferase [Seonamhaeicola marinus]